ncbi:MAG: cellulase family glycosylhydrolase [Chloroflexota bacterium]
MRIPLMTLLLALVLSATVTAQPPHVEPCEAGPEIELPTYKPSDAPFVTLEGNRFVTDGETFTLRGLNYYPTNYPWRRFLTESDDETLQTEMALIRDTGFNSLRIFLWNAALFDCDGRGTNPNPDAFARLDGVMQTAAEHDLYLIVTLNDLPHLPELYDNPAYTVTQTQVIVERYMDEGIILAWDLRNEGDIDYDGVNFFKPGTVAQDTVLDWLAEASQQVRELDENHLITAGWRYNEQHTLPYVDFVSFHHWRGAEQLRDRLEAMAYEKPVLLQEFGYTTFDFSGEVQATAIRDVVRLVEDERDDVLGWMVWTAFDFPLTATCYPGDCVSADNREHHFGIWHSDGTEKPAVAAIVNEMARLDER